MHRGALLLVLTVLGLAAVRAAGGEGSSGSGQEATAEPRPRARDLGIAPGVFQPGPLNAITDVEGVTVGQVTLARGDAVRTGVTAIRPHPGNLFQDKVPGAVYVGNAFGKLAGSTQVQELGTIETPIILTNTLAVGTAVDATVGWTLAVPGNDDVRSVNALVGETNDGLLNDIRGRHVTAADVVRAIESAGGGAVDEGAVGAGTGTVAFGWKAGIGTASRRVPVGTETYQVGVLVQANFGGVLTMDGVPVGKALGRHAFARGRAAHGASGAADAGEAADGSCLVVVATDAPLVARDLERLAARGVFALGRTGSSYSHGSGDYAIAFSTHASVRTRHGSRAPETRPLLPAEALSPLFQAVLEATEEAIYNSLLRATTTTGRGRTVEALPIDRLVPLLERRRF
jgi:D-aminopeptidase